jgi:NAD(P)-dependent dehydrogenase (short-subunit alcohol dehydrogenase family)
MTVDSSVAVVAGIGPGLSAAVCRRLAVEGYSVAGIARSAGFGSGLAADIEAAGGRFTLCQADVTDPAGIAAAFARIEGELGRISVLIYTAGAFAMRPITDTTPEEFQRLWSVNCFGGFVCAREAASRMLAHSEGTIILTGATASVKPGAQFAAFGSSKFALRGLAQGMARELGPKGVHVAHVVIDGVIWTPPTAQQQGLSEEDCLKPKAIAETYLHLIRQDRSAWTLELDLRPDREPF